jgi:hypothetical protein
VASRLKAKSSIVGGLLVGAALLWLAFRDIDFSRLAGIYANVSLLVVVPVFFATAGEMFLRALKWSILLEPSRPVRLWDAFRLEVSGMALNNVLPLRLGEIVRGTFGAGLFGIPVATVFATLVAERALDTIVLGALFVIAARLGGLGDALIRWGGCAGLLFAGLLTCLLVLVFIDEIMTHRSLGGLLRRFPRAAKGLGHLGMGIRAFHSFPTAAALVVLAVGQWLLNALNFYIVARAFGISGVLDVSKCVVMIFGAAVASAVPGMPGYFGNFEFAIARMAGSWGVDKDVAFAYATCVHLFGYVFVTAAGMLFVSQMGQSLGEVWERFRDRAADDGR